MNPDRLSGLLFQRSSTTYVEVTPSPLIALLAQSGMGVITRGAAEIVEIRAEDYSLDPDVDPDEDQVRF